MGNLFGRELLLCSFFLFFVGKNKGEGQGKEPKDQPENGASKQGKPALPLSWEQKLEGCQEC